MTPVTDPADSQFVVGRAFPNTAESVPQYVPPFPPAQTGISGPPTPPPDEDDAPSLHVAEDAEAFERDLLRIVDALDVAPTDDLGGISLVTSEGVAYSVADIIVALVAKIDSATPAKKPKRQLRASHPPGRVSGDFPPRQ